MRTRAMAAFLLVSAIWGSEWLFTRDAGPPQMGAISLRFCCAALVLWFCAAVRKAAVPRSRETVAISAVTGITFLAAPAVLMQSASTRLSPGLLVVLLAMTPLIAALLEGSASGELLVALVGGVGGTALLASQGLSFAPSQWPGAAAALAAAGSIAASLSWMRRRLAGVSVVQVAAIQLSAASASLAVWDALAGRDAAPSWSWSLLRADAFLALAGGSVALPLYLDALRGMESFELAASQWLVTIIGVGEALAVYRERPGWRLAGGAAILAGSLVAMLRSSREGQRPFTLTLTRRVSE